MNKIVCQSLFALVILTSCKFEPQKTEEVAVETILKMNPVYLGTYTKKEDHVEGQAAGIYTIYQQPVTGARLLEILLLQLQTLLL